MILANETSVTCTNTHMLIQQFRQIHVVTISNALVPSVNQSLSLVRRGVTCRERRNRDMEHDVVFSLPTLISLTLS